MEEEDCQHTHWKAESGDQSLGCQSVGGAGNGRGWFGAHQKRNEVVGYGGVDYFTDMCLWGLGR